MTKDIKKETKTIKKYKKRPKSPNKFLFNKDISNLKSYLAKKGDITGFAVYAETKTDASFKMFADGKTIMNFLEVLFKKNEKGTIALLKLFLKKHKKSFWKFW